MTVARGEDGTLDTLDLIASLRRYQDELEAQNHQLRALKLEYQRSMERYRDLYDLAPTGYITLDDSGTVLEANLALCDLLGVTRKAILGRPWSDFVHRDDQDVYFMTVRSRLSARGRHRSEFRVCTPDGAELWVLLEFTVVPHDPSVPGQALCSVVDITDDRRAIAALTRSRDLFRSLARRVQDTLDQERTDLSERVYEQISQDLVALGFDIHALETSMSTPGTPNDRGSLAAARTLLDACHRTLDEELRTLHPPILGLLGLPAAIQSELTRFSDATGIAGFFDPPVAQDELPRDLRSSLFHILREGLENVRRHANAGEVRVSLRQSASAVTLILQDDGTGVPDEVAAGSWGAGLLGASERAARFGGHIEVSGNRGRGTRLRVEVLLGAADDGGAVP